MLAGRNSVDADTGQVGPELAELLDLPFVTGVRHLALDATARSTCAASTTTAGCRPQVELPAVLSTAERLIDPCKVDPEGRAAVPADRDPRPRPRPTSAPGPWGQAGEPDRGRPRPGASSPSGCATSSPDAPLDEQVRRAVEILAERGALDPALDHAADLGTVPPPRPRRRRAHDRRARRARPRRASPASCSAPRPTSAAAVVALARRRAADPTELGGWGADEVVRLASSTVRRRDRRGGRRGRRHRAGCASVEPWAILAPSTAWGREVASRAAAAVGAGLTGDAVGLELDGDRLRRVEAGVRRSARRRDPRRLADADGDRARRDAARAAAPRAPRRRVAELAGRRRAAGCACSPATRDDDLDVLAEATVVVGVGQGVAPEDYPLLEPLRDALGAELAATRKVTDQGWLPRARQIGITGRSIAPRLYVVLGASGKFNHMVGVRAARTVLAVNTDPDALVFDAADVGIVGDWREVVPAARRARSSRRTRNRR